MNRNDDDWVRAALAGERAAFGKLYDRYAGLVRAICHGSTGGDLAAAQDLAQEVFLRVHDKLPGLDEPRRFAPWLVTVTRLVCKEWRRRRRRDRHEFRGADLPDEGETPAEGFDDEELDELRRALEELPDDERLAVQLHYLEDEAADTARAVLGVSRSGFYRLLERARNRLSRRLRPGKEASR